MAKEKNYGYRNLLFDSEYLNGKRHGKGKDYFAKCIGDSDKYDDEISEEKEQSEEEEQEEKKLLNMIVQNLKGNI